MSILKDFRYLDVVMCGTTLVVLEGVDDHQSELSFMQADVTPEWVINFRGEVNNFMDNELGENSRLLLKDATSNVLNYYEKAEKWLGIVRQQVVNHFEGQEREKIFDGLGYTAHWEAASHDSQSEMVMMLESYTLHLPKFMKLLISKRIGEKLLLEPTLYRDKLKQSDTTQEYIKLTAPEMNDAKRQKLNDIYSRIISICKIAQLFYKDQPAIRDKFVFSKIAEAMTNRYNKQVEEAVEE